MHVDDEWFQLRDAFFDPIGNTVAFKKFAFERWIKTSEGLGWKRGGILS
jgi:hypothetical protein